MLCKPIEAKMIYFVRAGNEGIKIGRTLLDPSCRMAAMQTGCPIKLTLIGMVEGSKQREKELHRQFKRFKVRGEWFSVAIAEEVQRIIGVDPRLITSKLALIDRQLAKFKDIDVINKLVYKKEMILKLAWL